MKSWWQDNDIEMYSSHSEGKSVVAERFTRTLKIKIYEFLTKKSKNVYIDELDNYKDPIFEVGDRVRISKYK